MRPAERQPTEKRAEGDVARGFSVDLAGALVLLVLGGVSLATMGDGVRDWGFPRSLTYLLLTIGVVLLARGLIRRKTGERIVLGRIGRNTRIDLTVFVAAVVAYVWLIPFIGLWIANFLMISGLSVYLAERRDRRTVVVSLIVAAAVCAGGYVVFTYVFFVPVPISLLWTLLG